MTQKVDKVLVIKHKRKLYLLSGDKVVRTYRIVLGRNPKGHKEYEGDMRTPEGLYIINDRNPNSRFHKNLGISYPNEKDIEHAKEFGKSPGGQIKIHGLKNGLGWVGRFHLLRNWTFGCIAVTDKEVDEIYEMVEIGTPIEIRP
ncbi:MAG: L,D-transpeptidase family protein [Bacteroidales bacterium]|nr:L,D-transpeptidase family protein [Bacteroidales bacterium]